MKDRNGKTRDDSNTPASKAKMPTAGELSEDLVESAMAAEADDGEIDRGNPVALLPIVVFLVLFLGTGIVFEYVLKVPMGFYSVPVVVVFLVALLVACLQNRKLSFDDKLELMGRGIGDKTIVTMILIFLVAGVFVGTVGRNSAESVAYFLLAIIPVRYAVVVLFVVSCFVSLAMGTSVGSITLITPIAAAVAAASGFDLALCVGSVVGGSMFGDNLSFISDTTIAACQGQNCEMKDKFHENFKIALPAALATIVILLILSAGADINGSIEHDYDLIELIPYIIVLVGGLASMNVFIVLLLGIVSGSIIVLATGAVGPVDLVVNMGTGAASMFETTMVAVLVSAIGALIREYGGFTALLYAIRSMFKSRQGGMLGMGILVGAMDVATANNTVAIVMANPIATEMAKTYDISRRRTASLLDTFSCVFQGIIPYGAQILVAISAAAQMGGMVSAFEVLPNLFYPYLLLVSSLVFIFIIPDKRRYDGEDAVVAAEAAE